MPGFQIFFYSPEFLFFRLADICFGPVEDIYLMETIPRKKCSADVLSTTWLPNCVLFVILDYLTTNHDLC